jgi:hypothetical protein
MKYIFFKKIYWQYRYKLLILYISGFIGTCRINRTANCSRSLCLEPSCCWMQVSMQTYETLKRTVDGNTVTSSLSFMYQEFEFTGLAARQKDWHLILTDPCIVDYSVEIPTRCNFVIEFIIPKFFWRHNMFRAAHRSSWGALNCICILWFICPYGDRPSHSALATAGHHMGV